MYLIDTAVISEARKGDRAHAGVRAFFEEVQHDHVPLFLATITVGELSRAVALMRHRGEEHEARQMEEWLQQLVQDHGESLLGLDARSAQLWGQLRAPHPEHVIDQQIAAIALVHDLTVVAHRTPAFRDTGVRVRDPWLAGGAQQP
ncbi:PIN domain-containing protein [Synechococcus sp. CCY 9618]|uniref:PIN domain-containing protein n=1 Tax=Synechococcus sp. CCY 9618 TaxID=2815602 RepID=UPI001C223B41|nr:PIN domain-containing protein [Synechococcus sp. CCY 9618]